MKEASREPAELILSLSEDEASGLQEAIENTQWIKLPFREAVLHLERAWNTHKKNGFAHHQGRDLFFTSALLVQSTDEHRWNLPMTKILGQLMSLEHQRDSGRGQAWFNSTVNDLFVVMKELPPKHDLPFLALLRAMNPRADQLISSVARKGANATHERSRKHKAEAQAEWATNGCGPIAVFARRRHDAYFVTERTLAAWLGEHKKTLNQ